MTVYNLEKEADFPH